MGIVKQASFDETVNCYGHYRKNFRKARFRAVTFSAGAAEIIPNAPPSSPNQDDDGERSRTRSQSCGDIPKSPAAPRLFRTQSTEDRIMCALETLRESIANRIYRARAGSHASETHSHSEAD